VDHRKFTNAEISLWNSLSSLDLNIEMEDMLLQGEQNPELRTLQGMSIFEKFTFTIEGHTCVVSISDRGLPDLKLEDLAVCSPEYQVISGNGKNLLQEFWEKKDGHTFLTVKFATDQHEHIICLYYEGGGLYRCEEVDTFLYFSGELVNEDHIYVHENCPTIIHLLSSHETFETHPVPRYVFSTRAEAIMNQFVEGAVVVVNGLPHRIKHKNTIDLVVKNYKAYCSDDKEVIFPVNEEDGIHEYDVSGGFVKTRKDKYVADTLRKTSKIFGLPTIANFLTLLKTVKLADIMYIQPQIIPREVVRQYVFHESMSKSKGQQLLNYQQGVEYVTSEGVSDWTNIDPMVYISEEFHPTLYQTVPAFDLGHYIEALKKRGIGFIYDNLRRWLIDNGVGNIYGKMIKYQKNKPFILLPYGELGDFFLLCNRFDARWKKMTHSYCFRDGCIGADRGVNMNFKGWLTPNEIMGCLWRYWMYMDVLPDRSEDYYPGAKIQIGRSYIPIKKKQDIMFMVTWSGGAPQNYDGMTCEGQLTQDLSQIVDEANAQIKESKDKEEELIVGNLKGIVAKAVTWYINTNLGLSTADHVTTVQLGCDDVHGHDAIRAEIDNRIRRLEEVPIEQPGLLGALTACVVPLPSGWVYQ